MLFAVEGGGFFSSSASGYSKGLTLLLLGQKNKKKPMRVIPWNQQQLVDEETKPELPLDSGKKSPVRRCACFVCFGLDDAGHESLPCLKVEPSQEVLPRSPDFVEIKDQTQLINGDDVNGDGISLTISSVESCLKNSEDSPRDNVNGDGSVYEVDISSISILKSSLKKSANRIREDVNGDGSVHGVNSSEDEDFRENGNEITCETQRRRVQWTDTAGGDLFEIREFEMSEDSDDDFDHRIKKTCSCSIM